MTPPSSSLPINPYHFGRPIQDPKDFYGREQQLRATFEYISRRECVNIIGERRSGKTSLLYEILYPQVWKRYISPDPNSLYVFVSAEITPQEPEGFFRDVFKEVKARYPDLPIDPDEGVMDERRVRATLEAILPRRLVLLIDEFEGISQCNNFPPRFFVFLRGLSFRYDISFVVSTRRRLFECCSHDVATSPFPNVFKAVELGPFTLDEFDDFMERTASSSGAPMLRVRDDVASMAGYFPYLVQIACWHYFQVWAERGVLEADARPLVRQRFEDDARSHFDSVWNRYLSDEERSTLQLLGSGEQDPRPHVIWRLEKKGYIVDGKIASDVFANLVKQQTLKEEQGDTSKPVIPSQGLWVDVSSGNVYVDGLCIDPPLTKHQFALVELLSKMKGRICSPYMIVSAVWSEDYIDAVDDQRIAQLISRLRRRLEPEGRPWKYILTVHGRGLTLGDG